MCCFNCHRSGSLIYSGKRIRTSGIAQVNVDASESNSAAAVVPSRHRHSTPTPSVSMPVQLMTSKLDPALLLASSQHIVPMTAPL